MSDSAPIISSDASAIDHNTTQNTQQVPSSGAASAQNFSTMEALRKSEPKLYQLMVEGCMQQFSRNQEWHNQQLKKILRENET